jgi:hypothetical protein
MALSFQGEEEHGPSPRVCVFVCAVFVCCFFWGGGILFAVQLLQLLSQNSTSYSIL